jgi:hypothetical protein
MQLFTPEGLQKVARGWSVAETPGTVQKDHRILKGCERASMTLIGLSLLLSHPFRMRNILPIPPGGSAALQPLATFCNPSGVKSDDSIPERCRRWDWPRSVVAFIFQKLYEKRYKTSFAE